MIPSKNEMYNALKKRCGEELFNKISSKTVAICGIGGLGSNIAIALVRAGVGKLILIDFDTIDITNLHRQQYKASQIGMFKTDALCNNLKEISPYIEIKAYTEKLTAENAKTLLKDADIICEAFDKPETKAEICDVVLSEMPAKFLVAASGMAGINSANDIKSRKITDKFYLCGDFISEVSEEDTLFSSRVMLCAAHQAHMVIRIIAEKYEV